MRGSSSTTKKITYKNLVSARTLASELFELASTGQQYKLKKDITKSLRVIDASMGGAKAKDSFLEVNFTNNI